MSVDRISQAMSRIDQALARIETQAALATHNGSRSGEDHDLKNRHEVLQRAVADSLGQLDALIETFER